jgi:thiamine biosynthesis lipoprotein
MITATMSTWKTELMVTARGGPTPGLQRALDRLLRDEVARLDGLASRFRADSELSAVNAGAGSWVEVSWGFVAVLTASLEAAQLTSGLVDPTLGRAVVAAGYDDWAGQTTETTPLAHTGRWTGIGIRPGCRQAQVRIPSGTALDLGSVAKAWLADRVARAVAASGYEVCANMGGDLRVIAGSPWTVYADAEVAGVAPMAMTLTDAGLATSGTGRRRWQGGHHLIDPRTGTPARTPWRTVAVLAGTAAQANAAATAGVILGEHGPEWLRRIGLDGRFAGEDGITTTGRWPMQEAA